MQTFHLLHKHGGRIVEVAAVGHHTDHDGVPYWYLKCAVEWDDGKGISPRQYEIAPDRLAYDQTKHEANKEGSAVLDALSKYLRERGRWLKKGKWKGDKLIHWTPLKPEDELAI